MPDAPNPEPLDSHAEGGMSRAKLHVWDTTNAIWRKLFGNNNGLFSQGNVAHDDVDAGNPLKIGLVARTADPTAVAAGDRVNAIGSVQGLQGVYLGDRDAADQVVLAGNWGSADARSTGVKGLHVASAPHGLAPDGSWDRLRTLQDTAPGLGVLAAAPYTPGASDVKSITVDVAATSAARATALTPTVGKKVRIINMEVVSRGLTTNPDRVGVYFGTGAAYTTTVANAIAEFVPGTTGEQSMSWPDGGGPVGAVDAVVSWITETETETTMRLTFQYREE